MSDLIERLEKATGPNRELDEAIALAVLSAGGEVRLLGMADDDPPLKMFTYPDGSKGTALRYTSSLDAALTLVPEGFAADIICYTSGNGRTAVWNEPSIFRCDRGSTPAIALCIAALKARAAAP